MAITRITTYGFRNLKDYNPIELSDSINIILGENGSGKTSFLEACYLVGYGKSFRAKQLKHVITSTRNTFAVNATDEQGNLFGISKDNNQQHLAIKLNGNTAHSLAEFASYNAVQILMPESFQMFFTTPKSRRKTIDFGVFHVEHQFKTIWKLFSRALQQRNSCLKHNQFSQLDYWTDLFIEYSEEVSLLRRKYIKQLNLKLNVWIKLLFPELEDNSLLVQYQQGWNKNKSLKEVIREVESNDKMLGFTTKGPQRFDVVFSLTNQDITNKVEEYFSRGQQKLFLIALIFSQAELVAEAKQLKPIILIDDLGSELDHHSRIKLFSAMNKMNCQYIVTAIEENSIAELIQNNKNYKLFHVKQGEVTLQV